MQLRNVSVYKPTEYVVVHLPQTTAPEDREQAIKFAAFCLNDRYGWLTIMSIALCLLFGGKLSFGVDRQQICSGLVARCIESGDRGRCPYLLPLARLQKIASYLPRDVAFHMGRFILKICLIRIEILWS